MKIDYNMTRDYCADWTAIDAIREMTQNAIDSGREYSCDVLPNMNLVSVVTKGVTLTPAMFAMGYSKKHGDSIGGYGEGFKLGMMILTREGLKPSIATGEWFVTGEFILNEFTQQETFCLLFDKQDAPSNDTNFCCDSRGIDVELLKERVTHFSETPLPKETNVGILYTRPGMIYVNGLYVCKQDKLTFGYNFSPTCITLNRDRNMVAGIESQLAQYYSEHGTAETIFHLLENDAHDVSYLYIWLSNTKLKAELARLFHNKYGEGATIGRPGTSYYGGSSMHVNCGSGMYGVMSKCGIEPSAVKPDPNAPVALLSDFIANNKKHMRSKAVQNANKLAIAAKSWKQA